MGLSGTASYLPRQGSRAKGHTCLRPDGSPFAFRPTRRSLIMHSNCPGFQRDARRPIDPDPVIVVVGPVPLVAGHQAGKAHLLGNVGKFPASIVAVKHAGVGTVNRGEKKSRSPSLSKSPSAGEAKDSTNASPASALRSSKCQSPPAPGCGEIWVPVARGGQNFPQTGRDDHHRPGPPGRTNRVPMTTEGLVWGSDVRKGTRPSFCQRMLGSRR